MENNRPNILLFMSDNQSADFIGCYGNSEVITPNIDFLAKTGMQYTSAFCTIAMCSPCRASVLTGLMPSGRMHLGHKMVIDQVKWFQDLGADVTIAVADLEAHATRGLSLDSCRKMH